MYTQWEKIDFERALRSVTLDMDLNIPAYVFDSAIRWLMDNLHSMEEASYSYCAQALWNGFTNTESWKDCSLLAHDFLQRYL